MTSASGGPSFPASPERVGSSSSAKLRILFYNHTRLVSGAEHMLLLMLRVLDRSLYEPTVACPIEGKGNLDEHLHEQSIPILPAPALQARFTSNPFKLVAYIASFLGTILSFRRQLLAHNPDLLHANSVRAGIVATLATLGTRIEILWHIQDDLPTHPISSAIRWLAYLSRRTRLVAVSKATAKAFAGPLDFGPRLAVLYNAIDLTRFPCKSTPLDPAAQSFRDELALTPDIFLIASVGMIHPRKGLLALLEALHQTRVPHDHRGEAEVIVGSLTQASAPPIHLAIVGAPIFNNDHLHEAALHARTTDLNLNERVHFLGQRKDVPAILRAANLLVLNATAEPFGLVLVEAISSGTPVLATQVGGIPEIITDNQTGFLTPPHDPPALAARITQLAANPTFLAEVANRAHAEVCPRFDLPIFHTAFADFYASLNLKSRRP